MNGVCLELLGCQAQLDLGGICQLKITSLRPNPDLSLRIESIRLVDRDGRSFRPIAMGIAGRPSENVLPAPSGVNLPQGVYLTFANVGKTLDDYDLLRIDFGPSQFANFGQPGKYFNSGKDCETIEL